MTRIRKGALVAMALVALTGCTREVILTGTRYDVRTPLAASLPEGTEAGAARVLAPEYGGPVENRSQPISLGAGISPSSWPQRSLTPSHQIPVLAFSGHLAPVFSVPIGKGDDRRHRIIADPVSDGSRVFTLDSRATVTAVSTAGAVLWSADLTPASDRNGTGSGGGLVVSGGRLYATTGYGTLTARDAATGAEIWTQKIDAVGNAAPTVVDGTVYVIGRDNNAWAVRASDGKVLWEAAGPPPVSGYAGGGGAAVDGRIAVLPFASGGLTAVLRQSGVRSWGTQIVGQRLGKAYATVIDITSDPVLVGDTLYAANTAGRLTRMSASDGEREWTALEGAMSPIVLGGGSIFLVSDNSEVVRLNAATGERIWGTALPDYVKPGKPRKRLAFWAHYGPLLAGGRVLVASSDELFRLYDPASGNLIGTAPLPGGAASNPIIVGGTLYVVTRDGRLSAFR